MTILYKINLVIIIHKNQFSNYNLLEIQWLYGRKIDLVARYINIKNGEYNGFFKKIFSISIFLFNP